MVEAPHQNQVFARLAPDQITAFTDGVVQLYGLIASATARLDATRAAIQQGELPGLDPVIVERYVQGREVISIAFGVAELSGRSLSMDELIGFALDDECLGDYNLVPLKVAGYLHQRDVLAA